MHHSPQRGISLHGNATYQRKYDLYYMFRLYIIYIDHILPALILLCPSKVIACIADRPSFSFIWLEMGKGHQWEPHQTVNQNICTQPYMWKTPRTGEMNPTYREKSFQMVISKSFPFFLGRRRKIPLVVVLSLPVRRILLVVQSGSYSPNFFHFLYCSLFCFFVHGCGRRRNRVMSCFKIAGYGN